MTPLDWHKRRQQAGMSVPSELALNLIQELEPICVMDVLHSKYVKGLPSTTTMHGGVKWLLDNKYVTSTYDTEDTRTKFLSLTAKGHRYFK
jgi:hypothetical protein